MPKPDYKTVTISTEYYKKLVTLATKNKRSISNQTEVLIDGANK